ncbi:hypothetical protein SLE2022_293050 [Rubroshorea leprosula]
MLLPLPIISQDECLQLKSYFEDKTKALEKMTVKAKNVDTENKMLMDLWMLKKMKDEERPYEMLLIPGSNTVIQTDENCRTKHSFLSLDGHFLELPCIDYFIGSWRYTYLVHNPAFITCLFCFKHTITLV